MWIIREFVSKAMNITIDIFKVERMEVKLDEK